MLLAGCVCARVCDTRTCMCVCREGFTSRVTELLDVLEDLNSGYYERVMVAEAPVSGSAAVGATPRTAGIAAVSQRAVCCRHVLVAGLNGTAQEGGGATRSRMSQCRGEIVLRDGTPLDVV